MSVLFIIYLGIGLFLNEFLALIDDIMQIQEELN